MGGIFGVASKSSCILDLFFGIDYHSHLGTRRGGMAVYDKKRGFDRVIHNIENAPFRTKFDGDIGEMEGNLGIGCISDNEPQPLLVRSHLGNFAITTVGKINNMDELIANCFKNGCTHFLEMSGGSVNPTEMVAALINQKDNMIEGIRYAQEVIEGSMTMLILTPKGILAARDRLGRTPLIVGKKEDACCVSFESFAYLNLGYEDLKELGPGEIVAVTPDGVETLQKPGEEMRICSFLWVYYGYPTSAYEGVNVEEMRYHCGDMLARRDRGEVNPDIVAGVPDSGIAHAIGYANQSGVPFARPFIKYTPTWPRSFMPTQQSQSIDTECRKSFLCMCCKYRCKVYSTRSFCSVESPYSFDRLWIHIHCLSAVTPAWCNCKSDIYAFFTEFICTCSALANTSDGCISDYNFNRFTVGIS